MNVVKLIQFVVATLLIASTSAVAEETPAHPPVKRVHLTDAAWRPLSKEFVGVYRNSVLRSHDDGVTWTAATIDSTGAPASCTALRSIAFADSLNAWISGDCQTVYRSTDGGETWKLVSAGKASHQAFVRLLFYDVTAGVAADATGQLLLTSDAARTWELFAEGEVFVAAMGRTSLHGVSVVTGEWTAGVNGYSDFGDGESSGTLEDPPLKLSRDFVARGIVLMSRWAWAVPEARTSIGWINLDDSSKWIFRPATGLQFGEKIADATFTDGGSGWLAGDRGTLLRTQDSGHTWEKVATVRISRFLDMNHAWKSLALNERGEVIYAEAFKPTAWQPARLARK